MISTLAKVGISFFLGITCLILTEHLWIHLITILICIVTTYFFRFDKSLILLSIFLLTGGLYQQICASDQKMQFPQKVLRKLQNFRIESIKKNGEFTTLDGTFVNESSLNISAQLSIQSCKHELQAGTIIKIKKVALHKIQKNPFRYYFDFNSILLNRGIQFKGWIINEDIDIIGYDPSFRFWIIKIREHIGNRIKSVIPNTYGIMMAICLGEKSDIDKNSKNLFIKNGIAHIMAVSGLHIGIVYLIFLNIFRILPSKKQLLKIIVPVVFVWIFILITGAPVSAIRAGLMISIYSIFNLLGRKSEKLHIIVLTGFIILLIDPTQLTSIGFQLSFLALIGILYFTDFFLQFFKSKYLLINYFGSIMAMSLAVQITTLPLSIYYFHSFPFHFLITNIVAIPFAFIILILFLIYLPFIAIPIISNGILQFSEKMILFVLQFLEFFENYNWLHSKDLFISEQTLFTYYVVLFSLFSLPFFRIRKIMKVICLICICFLVEVYSLKRFKESRFIYAYNHKGICILIKTTDQIVLFHEGEKVDLKYFHPIVKNKIRMMRLKSNTVITANNRQIAFNVNDQDNNQSMRYIYTRGEIPLQIEKNKILVSRKLSRKYDQYESIDGFKKL